MNKERRKQIGELRDRLEKLQGEWDDIKSELETVKDEEQDCYDNMPESFQNGDKGQRAQEAVDALENAHSEMDGFNFEDVMGYLDTAAE